jgi:hypothetical protein
MPSSSLAGGHSEASGELDDSRDAQVAYDAAAMRRGIAVSIVLVAALLPAGLAQARSYRPLTLHLAVLSTKVAAYREAKAKGASKAEYPTGGECERLSRYAVECPFTYSFANAQGEVTETCFDSAQVKKYGEKITWRTLKSPRCE